MSTHIWREPFTKQFGQLSCQELAACYFWLKTLLSVPIARPGPAEGLPLIASECVISSACRHEDEIALANVQATEPPDGGGSVVFPRAAFPSC